MQPPALRYLYSRDPLQETINHFPNDQHREQQQILTRYEDAALRGDLILLGAVRQDLENAERLASPKTEFGCVSGGGKHVDRAVGKHILGALGIGFHMRGSGMRAKRGHAFPLFDNDKRVFSEWRLDWSGVFGVDRGFVGDAAILCQNGRDIRVEQFQHLGTFARFGFDDGDNVDH